MLSGPLRRVLKLVTKRLGNVVTLERLPGRAGPVAGALGLWTEVFVVSPDGNAVVVSSEVSGGCIVDDDDVGLAVAEEGLGGVGFDHGVLLCFLGLVNFFAL